MISKENRDDASNIASAALADYQQAQAQLAAAELNLKRTRIIATVDGYVTNLNIHKGDYARTGEAVMAVVDENSFWVYGFFEETKLPHVKVGDQAELQMMSGERIKGHVEYRPRHLRPRQPAEPRADRRREPDLQLGASGPAGAGAHSYRSSAERLLLAAGTTCTVVVKPSEG